ncbi:hypothetical protein [Plebeiibacterium sediminum]|uniref:Uncharacterized protein n=1 Tax=Plebeiibacterium sediminum TaxID=2992112 RepID=A0AAE3M7Q0_9BACT|nr:hypothetical protein [Plebeiobacterium sediminum]MCW3788526.1 hypothetical protein [Plebeiobacterium sediminum]
MARLNIHGNIILTFEFEAYVDVYWKELSEFIIEKYGNKVFDDNNEVEAILLDSFDFFLKKFQSLIEEEKTFSFFLYTFFLNEQSWDFLIKIRSGHSLGEVNENDFSIYRRVLKLILEQGCDIDLASGDFPTGAQVLEFDEKIQKLYYLGSWIYTFAEQIAYQKMIGNAHTVDFDSAKMIGVEWKKHYDKVYTEIIKSEIPEDYSNGVYDINAVRDLKTALNSCFNIEYDEAISIIFQVKRHFSNSDLQTIEPYVLPINLAYIRGIETIDAENFYNGMSISRTNKLSLQDAILKPYSTERYMYRPILIYNIDGVERALIGEGKLTESLYILANNAISWNTIPKDWRLNKCMVRFMSRKGNEHDKILEDKIEALLLKNKYRYCRNIKSFKRPNQNNLNIDNHLAGEIDFIIVNDNARKIFVADSKYNKSKYEAVGYRSDYSNFLKSYEPQLSKKVNWIRENKIILQEHLKIIYNLSDYSITSYDVEGLFFINTPTFYMYNGTYKAITINKFESFLLGEYTLPVLEYRDCTGKVINIQHPYFKE